MRKIPVVFLLMLTVSVTLHGQITLERCQELARNNYPEISRYGLVSCSEEYNISNASRNWIPQITFSAQATWQSAVATFPEQFAKMLSAQGVNMPGLAKDQYRAALDVSQTIWDGGASKAGKELAVAQAREQRLESDADFYALEERVSNIYFGILLLDENYNTCLSRQELLERNRKKVESMCREGLALSSDLEMVKVEQLMLGQVMDQNRASRDSYCAMLGALTGISVENEELARPSEVLVYNDGSNRPELLMLDARLAVLDARNAALKVSLTPKFAAFAQGYYGYPGLDMFASMMNRDWKWNAVIGIRMQWNISAFFTYASDKRNLDNTRKMVDLQKDVFRYNLNLKTIQENGEISRMRRAVDSDEEIVRLRSNIRAAAESQLSGGVIDTSTLLKRINEETEATVARNLHEIELLKKENDHKHTLK